MAGGPLTSKPTWSNAMKVLDHVGLFYLPRQSLGGKTLMA